MTVNPVGSNISVNTATTPPVVAQDTVVQNPKKQVVFQQAHNSSSQTSSNKILENSLEDSTYRNDIMGSTVDFYALALEMFPTGAEQVVTVQGSVHQKPVQTPQTPATSFAGEKKTTENGEDLTNYLVKNEETKKDEESGFKWGPAIGSTFGLAAPFLCNKFRTGKFLSKELWIKAPVLAVGGLCVGGIIQGLTASAKKLTEVSKPEAPTPAQMPAKPMDVKA